MKTLVTGANGLLGANVVRELESRGKEVRVLVRPRANLLALKGTRAEMATGDILDPVSLGQALNGCDEVIHAAANTNQWPVHYEAYEAVNVTGTRNVIRACLHNGIKRAVFVSTANTFGPGSKETPGTELSEFNGYHIGSGYITSKFVAQQQVIEAVEKHGLPAVIVNPTFMIGPFDAKPSSGRIIFIGLKNRIQACPAGGKNFIHVRDAAAGVCNALELGRVGECYLLAGTNLTYREFYDLLNDVAGKHPFRVFLPAYLVRAAGMFGTLAEKLAGTPMPLNYVNARLLTLDNYYSPRKAAEEIGLPCTPVKTAIAEAMEWFMANSML